MVEQTGIRRRRSRVVVGSRIPHRRSVGSAIPLAHVIEAHAVVQGKLTIGFERILRVKRPLMDIEVVGWCYVLLLIVPVNAEEEVSHCVAAIVRSPTHVVIALVSHL